METYAKQNLQLLSQTLLERIQPAVVFKDKGAIDQILATTQPNMLFVVFMFMFQNINY
jgi:hypothetical protein